MSRSIFTMNKKPIKFNRKARKNTKINYTHKIYTKKLKKSQINSQQSQYSKSISNYPKPFSAIPCIHPNTHKLT